MKAIRKNNNTATSLFEKDIWTAEEIGMKPSAIHGMYHLKFSKLNPPWLRDVIKKFIHLQLATKTFATCYSYINRLNTFSIFLERYNNILPTDINRKLIVDYISYLSKLKMKVSSKNLCLIHLSTLHSVVVKEKWLDWPHEQLIFSSDYIPNTIHIPKFIPEGVISQLLKNLPHLSEYMQHVVIILLETGRRVSEVCMMPYDCLSKDEQGNYFLRVNDSKMKKSYLIPISDKCVTAIKSQQKLVREKDNDCTLLFPARFRVKSPYISGRHINTSLNKLARNYKILDDNGEIWQFHTHQFRHTVGTRMINTNVPQPIVQKYLGHESADMTARYAHIHNATLKKEFTKYQDRFVNIHGKTTGFSNQLNDAKWLKHNIMAQALPNGVCGLPSVQQGCPHANACLTCVNFKTSKKYLSQHKQQLCTTNKIITQAKENGWDRQYEMNMKIKHSLESIITGLTKDNKQ